jgi:hypothetical protein
VFPKETTVARGLKHQIRTVDAVLHPLCVFGPSVNGQLELLPNLDNGDVFPRKPAVMQAVSGCASALSREENAF